MADPPIGGRPPACQAIGLLPERVEQADAGSRDVANVQGSGALLRWLLERDLVDELTLVVYPVVVGDGLRLFPEHGPTHTMELVESRPTPSGITIQTYRPAGRLTFGTLDA